MQGCRQCCLIRAGVLLSIAIEYAVKNAIARRVFRSLLAGVLVSPAPIFAQYGSSSLYPAGPGRYGGDAYQDSSGEYWDRDTRYGAGKYGGGDYTDSKGNEIYCDRSGYCTNY